jgi:hypothetical protein
MPYSEHHHPEILGRMFSPAKETDMINRIFVIVFSIGCLLAILVFNRPAGLMPSGQTGYFNPIHYASPTVPDKPYPYRTGFATLP